VIFLTEENPCVGTSYETLKRYLLTHLLISHADTSFDLAAWPSSVSIENWDLI